MLRPASLRDYLIASFLRQSLALVDSLRVFYFKKIINRYASSITTTPPVIGINLNVLTNLNFPTLGN